MTFFLLRRALAYYLDCTIAFTVVMLGIQWLILLPMRPLIGWDDKWLHESWNMQMYVWLTISLPVFLYFTLMDSRITKGTFGKRIFKLKVVNNKGTQLSIGFSFLRTFFKLLPWELAHIGVIFPQPLYFQENPEIQLLTYLGLGLFLTYLITVIFSHKKSPYDFLLHTKVVDAKK